MVKVDPFSSFFIKLQGHLKCIAQEISFEIDLLNQSEDGLSLELLRNMSFIWVWSHISVTPAGMRLMQKVNKFQTA